jgi:hypothetical protein
MDDRSKMPIFVRAWTYEPPCARHAVKIWSRLVRKGAIRLSREKEIREQQRKQFHREAKAAEAKGTIQQLIAELEQQEQEWNSAHPLPEIPQWAPYALVLDCETTTDRYLHLTFCWWRFCRLVVGNYVCENEGVTWPDTLPAGKLQLIRQCARTPANVAPGCERDIRCEPLSSFIWNVFWEAIRMGAAIVGLNLAFDLSRLMPSRLMPQIKPARAVDGGWTAIPWLDSKANPAENMPRIRFRPKDSRISFMWISSYPGCERIIRKYCFLDLSALGFSLRNVHGSLKYFCGPKEKGGFGVPESEAKLPDYEPTGQVTKAELRYGRQDVRATVALLNAMKQEFDGFGLRDLRPELCMSPASITKAMLAQMGITPPLKQFQNVSHEDLGCAMQSYFGGRSEVHIRHEQIPVVVTDVTSEYPSCASLLGIWDLITAESIEKQECTAEAKQLLSQASLDNLLDPTFFSKLGFFARLRPHRSTLPVRALYDGRPESDTNIGINHLISRVLLWYGGPDLAAAALQDGYAPDIECAFRLIPHGRQKGLEKQKITLGGCEFRPDKDDFFRFVIEQRAMLPKTHPHHLLLKIIANSFYGTFAELNKKKVGKNARAWIQVFSGEFKHSQFTSVLETAGRYSFPPAAALITSAGRLLLSLLEKMAAEKGGTHALTDTDSMFFVSTKRGEIVPCEGGPHTLPDGQKAIRILSWAQVARICERLGRLNPYDPDIVNNLLKVESLNYTRENQQVQLYAFCVSSKRYVVYRNPNVLHNCVFEDELGNQFQVEIKPEDMGIVKPSQHGLGTYFVPDNRNNKRYQHPACADTKTDYPRYLAEIWADMLKQWYVGKDDPIELRRSPYPAEFPFAHLPAVRRFRISTPNVLRALRKLDPEAGWPYNFGISPVLRDRSESEGETAMLVGPHITHLEHCQDMHFVDIKSKKGIKVRIGELYKGKRLRVATLGDISNVHWRHPEPKFLGPDGKPCTEFTRGLLKRRTVYAVGIPRLIGKEVERKIEGGYDVEASIEKPIVYEPNKGIVTRAADAEKIERAKNWPKKLIARKAGVDRNAVRRYIAGKTVRPSTRAAIEKGVRIIERQH